MVKIAENTLFLERGGGGVWGGGVGGGLPLATNNVFSSYFYLCLHFQLYLYRTFGTSGIRLGIRS